MGTDFMGRFANRGAAVVLALKRAPGPSNL